MKNPAAIRQMPCEEQGKPSGRVDLGRIVQEALGDLEIAVEHANAEVRVGELPSVEADESQMRQLFQNLIGNALKYRRDDVTPRVEIRGRIKEESEAPEPIAVLEVEDNGIGFDEKFLDRIFLPSRRLHSNEKYEGSGIGLAVCRRIVERHGGSITARSTPGAGSTFVVELPVHRSRSR